MVLSPVCPVADGLGDDRAHCDIVTWNDWSPSLLSQGMFSSELEDADLKWESAYIPQGLGPMDSHSLIRGVFVAMVMN